MTNGVMEQFVHARIPVLEGPKAREREIQRWVAQGFAREQVKRALETEGTAKVWVNDQYQVLVIENPKHGFPDMELTWLSIRRKDRAPVHDWRDLQAIKNALVGPEYEAIELYPAEARVVDTANQYHLWVFRTLNGEPAPRIPLGFGEGLIINDALLNTKQRPRG